MKKLLMVLILAMMTMAVSVKAQPTATQNDTIDEVEVFSDTTSIDSVAIDEAFDDADDDNEDWERWESSSTHSLMGLLGVDGDMLGGMFFVLVVLFIIFVLAPVVVIGLILYFIYKSRKDKMRLMEMAMKNGKEIPLDALGTPYRNNDDIWNKGIRQIFIGVGVGILLWIPIGKLGLAIGALIALIGCGNVVIAQNAKDKQRKRELHERIFNKTSADRTEYSDETK